MTKDVYAVHTPRLQGSVIYYVKAVSSQDARLTLVELGIPVPSNASVESAASPVGAHLIVSVKHRKTVLAPPRSMADEPFDATRYPNIQATAIIAGTHVHPAKEEGISDIRLLLSDVVADEREAKRRANKAREALALAEKDEKLFATQKADVTAYLSETLLALAEQQSQEKNSPE